MTKKPTLRLEVAGLFLAGVVRILKFVLNDPVVGFEVKPVGIGRGRGLRRQLDLAVCVAHDVAAQMTGAGVALDEILDR
jgi:hypothetical protein